MKIKEFFKQKRLQEERITTLKESLDKTQELLDNEKQNLREILEVAYRENLFQISYSDLLNEICEQNSLDIDSDAFNVNISIKLKIWYKRDREFVEDYIRRKKDVPDCALRCVINVNREQICDFDSKLDIDEKLPDGTRLWDHIKTTVKYNNVFNEYNTFLELDKDCYKNLTFNVHPLDLEVSVNKKYLKPALISHLEKQEKDIISGAERKFNY